jgi:hypothetical protein
VRGCVVLPERNVLVGIYEDGALVFIDVEIIGSLGERLLKQEPRTKKGWRRRTEKMVITAGDCLVGVFRSMAYLGHRSIGLK